MLKLIIADDEQTTRDSLKELVPWAQLGITAVETACDGQDALAKAAVFLPDIALCDVRMPRMDGITLATHLRREYPKIQIMFLSGYSDTAYLKSAIQLKAEDYLEKPVDITVLTSAMQKAVEAVLQEREQEAAQRQAATSLKANTALLREKALQRLVSGQDTIETLLLDLGPEVVRLSPSGEYIIASVLFNFPETLFPGSKGFVQNTLLEWLAGQGPEMEVPMAGFVEDNLLAVVLHHTAPFSGKTDTGILERLVSGLLRHCPESYTASAALGKVAQGQSLTAGALSSHWLYAHQFYAGPGIIACPEEPGGEFMPDKSLYTQFRLYLRTGNEKDCERLVCSLASEIVAARDYNIEKIKNIFYRLFLIILEECNQWTSLENEESRYIRQEFEAFITLDALKSSLLASISSSQRTGRKDAATQKVEDVKRYIHLHYGDNQLSIKTISENVFLSETYLCALFKKVTGFTINEYVTHFRVERACELLAKQKIKLGDLAAQLGFTDTNYFSTLFKKKTGLTPTEYRENMAQW